MQDMNLAIELFAELLDESRFSASVRSDDGPTSDRALLVRAISDFVGERFDGMLVVEKKRDIARLKVAGAEGIRVLVRSQPRGHTSRVTVPR